MKPTLMERLDYLIWGECEMCRMFRAGLFVGFIIASIVNVFV